MPTTDKLPTHPYIVCSTPSCSTQTTCFGKNLEIKIASYGGLDKLLAEFKCRTCRKGDAPSKPAAAKTKTKRISKKQTRATMVTEMIQSIPAYVPQTRVVNFLKDSPDLVSQISKESGCIRPDIFLDNDRVCDDCPYNQHCQANNKTFSKRYKQAA